MKFKSRFFAAPMVRVSDTAFRIMCYKYGAGLVFTEMTYAAALARGIDKVNIDRRREKSVGIQLAGTKLGEIEKAVKFIEDKVDVFDYNLGCPVSKAQRQKVGAILLEEPRLVRKILSKIVSSTNKPVFAKIRSGYSDKNINYLTIGKIAQDVGCAAVTLHPRTAATKRSGGANWDHIKKLKSKLDIPVIGNGDVNSPEDALQLMSTTDCDYVMLGRAAAKNPAIFKQCNDFIKTGKYKESNQIKLANEYMELAKKYNIKFSTIKSHVTYFLKPHAEIINKTKDLNTLKKTVKSL
ncbi:tRNA-dihydrouridine synthase family protein [Candidatus Woesearchaeota archaeon]|jgi:tRNA-dihydrouridine synthase B|nr:tRNA-dihydrouridine synthase family protein [Candidatus Woesearchaeota archaeon]